MKRSTMSDVAKRAGVSKTTVSHVINSTRFVEEETKQRVLKAIAELGYRPCVAARSLKTKRTQTVGVLVTDVSNYFFAEVLHGSESVLMPNSYSIIVCNTDGTLDREVHYLDLLLRQRVDGIIAAAASQKWDILSDAEMQHTPIVFVDRYFEGLERPFVGVDNRKGAYLGTSHLIERGHRRIGILVGSLGVSNLRERLVGFRQALQEHNISLPQELVVTGSSCAREEMRQLLMLPERPTAVFCSTNQLSLETLATLKEMGLRCPEDVALVGFDDHPWAAVSDPPLTVIRQPARQLGQLAARILLDLISNRKLPETRFILDCELVLRQSC